MRSAGSKGPFDLITISSGGDVQLIQCKRSRSARHLESLMKEFKENPPLGHRERATYHQVMETLHEGEIWSVRV